MQIKLTDFGSCRYYKGDQSYQSLSGTVRCLAPEVVKGDHYDFKVDSWGLGLILFELLTGFMPFYSSKPERNLRNIIDGKIEFEKLYNEPWYMNVHAVKLLKGLLEKDPSKRISVSDALDSIWFECDVKPRNSI